MSTSNIKMNASKSLTRKRRHDEDGYPLDFLGRMLSVGDVVIVSDLFGVFKMGYVEKLFKSCVYVRDPQLGFTERIGKPYRELIKVDLDDVPTWHEDVKMMAAVSRDYA